MAQNFQNPYNLPDLTTNILPSYNSGLTPQQALDYYYLKPAWQLTLQQLALLEDNANPYVPIDDLGNGWYAGDERGIDILNNMRSNIGDLLEDFNQLLKKAEKTHWWTSRKKQRERLGALSAEKDRLLLSLDVYNKERTRLGLEGVIPPLEDYSEETLNLTIEESTLQSASNRAASLEALKTKGPEYIGAAFDAAKTFTKDPSAYDGAKGSLTQGLDSAGDAMANAAMASGNPYAMAAAAAYKVMGFANRAIGGGTDGMTNIDAALDSNLGFLATGGLSKLNGALGGTTDKFEVDNDLKAQMSSSYMDTYGELGDAASVAGKRYGFLSRGKMKRALDDIAMAKARQDTISSINETAQDRIAAGNYEGIGFRNLMNLNGGYKSLRAAKQGLKLSLDFAKKITRAQRGFKFNRFKMVLPSGVSPNKYNVEFPETNIDTEEPMDLYSNLSEADLNALGIKYVGNAEGIITYQVGTLELADRLNKNNAFKNRLKRKYKANDIIFLFLNETPLLSNEELQTDLSSNLLEQAPQSPELLEEPEEDTLAEEPVLDTPQEPITPVTPNPLEDGAIHINFSNPANDRRFNLLEALGLTTIPDNDTLDLLLSMIDNGKFEEFANIFKLKIDNAISPLDLRTIWSTLPKKLHEGGVFTFMPYTDELVAKFKEGGSFNVIPDGALHKNRHNMEDAEGLTKKGIPVVTEEDGKKVQQAEIEVNEIIFRLEVTEKLEKLAKEGTDEAALEAGKLLTEEILHNTHDNTGLIKETV